LANMGKSRRCVFVVMDLSRLLLSRGRIGAPPMSP
jgi:hypothetical protein